MADIVELAEAVAALFPDNGEVAYAPEYDLRGLKEAKVVVVPVGIMTRPTARDRLEEHHVIQVGLLKRCGDDEVPALVTKVAEIGRMFAGRTVASLRCVKAEYAPLFSPEHLRERKQFTGVVELTFLAARRNGA